MISGGEAVLELDRLIDRGYFGRVPSGWRDDLYAGNRRGHRASLTREPGDRAFRIEDLGVKISGGSDAGYAIPGGAAVALSAATAKSVQGIKSHANFGVSLHFASLSYDGVTAAAVPALCEIAYCTFGANAPGTNSTSITTLPQAFGRVLTAGFTAGRTWTTEPTTITPIREFLLAVLMGTALYDYPLGKEPDSALGEGFVHRCTAPAIVNVRSTLDVRRA